MAAIAEIRMSLSRNPSAGPMTKSSVSRKRHAACDECRQRKLKCSGEAGGCSRCVKQNLYCHYSIQKPMGRPPKSRVRQEDAHTAVIAPQFPDYSRFVPGMVQAPLVPGAAMDTPYTSYMMSPSLSVSSNPMYGEQGDGQASIQVPSSPYPTPPSYSHSSSIDVFTPPTTSTPFPLGSVPVTSPEVYRQVQPLAPCSCVSYMYLCLNSLSTITCFPPSSQTLSTLYNAARNARGVIYCEICPQAFHSSVQNLMILGSLLNVIGDTWFKISQMDAEQLGRDVLCPSFIASLPSDPGERQRRWKRWLRHVVRHAVIGCAVTPMVDSVQEESAESPSLLALIEELETRQRLWHAQPRPPSACRGGTGAGAGVFRTSGDQPAGEADRQQDAEYWCTRTAGTARQVIERFEFSDEEMMG
ncbi:C6 finger domain-containing protein [Blastomyces gilchristii SLH14081]|uniref:C6 finger domain-containing protein n=1 Tax=Blastomyces gilchristii (strain SLH14081) TaxID=559298 RepID=A0A179UIP5_BLAGS|nr:C6 finger domain-containing protein [Blastomyces gilchristii SLH14081]OAT07895.1 C6 finger domain-containing protein [Blastomyces gilchristii SLH14081]